jgi:DNA modification methylase
MSKLITGEPCAVKAARTVRRGLLRNVPAHYGQATRSASTLCYANCGNYPPVLRATGLYFAQAIIWDKQHPVLTRKDFMGAHEWCFYGWKEGAAHVFLGPNNATDLWHVKKVNPQSMVHLTEKPVELAVRAIQYSSRAGENVLDLFGGSGSTLIAAEQTGRHAYLMELDALYADVIVQRWEKFTGRKAERALAEVHA